ncbi:MAG: response regulator [Cyanobacteria bacterium P01_C01_bin.120]
MSYLDINILVVDDDEVVRRNLEKALRREGYTVEIASDSQSACLKFEESPIHLAILDLMMPDLQGKFSGRAGIDLLTWIKQYHPETFTLMLTGAGTGSIGAEANSLGAGYIEKDELQPKNLKDKIREIVNINYELKIDFRHSTQLANSEDEEILRRLFIDSSEIKVSKLNEGSRGTVIYQVISRNFDGSWRVPFATKITWKSLIIQEEKNYPKWVENQLGGFRYANIIGKAAYSFKRGGINMSFLNVNLDGLREFSLFFQTSDTETVVDAISKLFKETLSNWYEGKEPEYLNFVEEYSKYLNVENWNLRRSINRHLKEFKDSSYIKLEEVDICFPNPISAFERLLESRDQFNKRSYISTTHGDLHASNILVDSQNNSWLIDFSNTGKSHIFRDFIELEVSLKFDLLDTKDLNSLLELESTLLSQETFQHQPSFTSSDIAFQKAFHVIMKVREYAYLTIAPKHDIYDYYIGLLFYSLNMLRFSSNAVNRTKKICILYSAFLILKRLEFEL